MVPPLHSGSVVFVTLLRKIAWAILILFAAATIGVIVVTIVTKPWTLALFVGMPLGAAAIVWAVDTVRGE